MSRVARAAAAVLAVVAYALPLTLGLVADLGHAAHHIGGTVQEHRRLAAELGLVHGQEASRPAGRPPVPQMPGRFVHQHGGTTHSHGAATDALLIAAAQADEDGGGDQAPTSPQLLSLHMPAPSPAFSPLAAASSQRAASFEAPSGLPPFSPTPPPPRA